MNLSPTMVTRPAQRAGRMAQLLQRAAIRSQLATQEGRRFLVDITHQLDLDGALTLLEEVAVAPEDDRARILSLLSVRPERVLRQAALRALSA